MDKPLGHTIRYSLFSYADLSVDNYCFSSISAIKS